jgi:CheY-like chemotaxis protein
MAGKRVLVVDDELPVRELLGTMLAHLGHSWEAACNAAEALRKIESSEFDLVLTDFNMPGTNGIELAREIKKRQQRIPVILVTGSQVQDPSPDIDGILRKPFSGQQLREIIAELT